MRVLRGKGDLGDLSGEGVRRGHTAHYVVGVGYHHNGGMRRRQVPRVCIEAWDPAIVADEADQLADPKPVPF